MVKDSTGREGLSVGAIAKQLDVSPQVVKKALGELKVNVDFVKAGCGYYYADRVPALKARIN
jgi:DNA-binding transcriptional regulator YhcF (GntR family)